MNTISKKSLFEISAIAWPMALNAVLLHSVSIIDLSLIASLGDVPVAAFGIAGAITSFIIGIQFAIANGTQLVLSRAVGAGNIFDIGLAVSAGWLVNLGFSFIALIALIFGTEPLIHLITHDESVALQAIRYVKISLLILFFSSISQVIAVYFNATKKTRIPLYGFLLEIPINVICSAVLIFGLFGAPAMGLAGAAWGSVLAIFVRFMYLVFRFNQERQQGHVAGFNKVKPLTIKTHMDEVVPIVANFMVLLTGQLLFQALFAQLSVSSYAAITLILPWIKIGSIFVNSWAQSSTIMVSQFIGAKDYSRIKQLVLDSKWVATLISFLMVAGFYLFSRSIPHLYTQLSQETINALAIIAPGYIFIPLFRTNNMFCGNMIRAMGDSYLIVRINIITQWCIALPLCALLIFLKAPLLATFGVILLDEMLKFYSFRSTLMRKLASYESVA